MNQNGDMATPRPLTPEDTHWKRAAESAGDGVWDWSLVDDAIELSAGLSQIWQQVLGHPGALSGARSEIWSPHIHPDDRSRVEAALRAHLNQETAHHQCEYRLSRPDGQARWVLSRGTVVERGPQGEPLRMIGTLTDIHWRKHAEQFEQFRSHILEMLAGGEDLPVMLDAIVRSVEQLVPSTLCSILLLDPDGVHLRHGAAPSLPAFYNEAIDGLAIGPNTGSCGTAMYTGQRVIVEDIQRHPYWELYKGLAARAGLGACWSQPVLSAAGKVLGSFAIYHRQPQTPQAPDIQLIEQTARLVSIAIERKESEERLHLAASVFTHAREGILITGPDATIIDVNEAFTRITGYTREEAIGRKPNLLNSGRQDRLFYTEMWRALLDRGHWQGELWNRRKSGEHYAEMKTISAVKDAQGQVRQYVALFSDITALKTHEEQLRYNAQHDALTGLPNRVLLGTRLDEAMAHARQRELRLAVLYLDLDGFKEVNDRHGHEVGDQLLVALALRMRDALRESDTLARLGGDEFVAVLHDHGELSHWLPAVNRILAAAAQPVLIGPLSLQVSASVGVTTYPQSDAVDADQLLRQADQAMYQAKLLGKNRCHVFDSEQDRHVRGHHESLERIRQALAQDELVLHYQPKVNLRTGQVIGAEALIRWQHPEHGLLSPAAFLPVIEDHALAIEVGEWVIHTALAQITTWRAQGLRLPVSVNLAARQLQQSDFVDRLRQVLAAHASQHKGELELEVLETSALGDLARISQVIDTCKAMGVSFALDDFGTGYSSLTYLKRLPVDLLKIDQSFVRDMLDDPDDLAILEGILGLSTAFHRQVIAEGVETVDHGEMLLYLGCELAQGYGIARPMPADALPGWVQSWRPHPRWLQAGQVRRDDVPLMLAIVKHRAWVQGIERYLRQERDAPPPLNVHHCDLGRWMAQELWETLTTPAQRQRIDALHHEIHRLAETLCALHAQTRSAEALARLGELQALRDAMLAQLQALHSAPPQRLATNAPSCQSATPERTN